MAFVSVPVRLVILLSGRIKLVVFDGYSQALVIVLFDSWRIAALRFFIVVVAKRSFVAAVWTSASWSFVTASVIGMLIAVVMP